MILTDVILEPPAPGEMLNFEALFGAGVPVEMEIGVGKGTFLLERARAHADRGFLGIEWANKIHLYAADRMVRWGVSNVRLMRADASHLARFHIPAESLTLLHIYHPDPWPKKRHHKRRLIQLPFIVAATTTLKVGGRLAIQTDHAEYFEQIQQVLAGEPRLCQVEFNVPEAGVVDGQIRTNFEIKYLREGRAIYQIAMQRSS